MIKCSSAGLAAITISLGLIIGFIFLFAFFPKEEDQFFLKPKSAPQAPSLYSVHILSWNVAGKKPNIKLLPLLGINSTFKPDFIVVGIQETLVGKFDFNFITHNSAWPKAVDYELSQQGYQQAGLVQNKAMDLLVYVKTEHSKN